MPRSGIGFGYVVSLTGGALCFPTKMGPISEVAPLCDGTFLVGYQGYGAFETLHYGPDGAVRERWNSHGYYVIGDEWRVIELENVLPSKMHLARLDAGGLVTRGDRLEGYYTSRPWCSPDGTVYFFRRGELLAARGLAITGRLVLEAPETGLYATRIVARGPSLYFAYTRSASGGDQSGARGSVRSTGVCTVEESHMIDDEGDEDEYRPPKPWPWWVALGLWGLPGRGWAWGCFWLSLLLSAACVAAGFVFWPAFLGGIWVLAAWWYYAAIRWVDRHGDWP
jgi:hypothetical protein